MKKFYQSVIATGLFIATAVAYAEQPQTLREIIEITVTTNPEVQSRYHTYLAAVAEQGVAKGGLLPRADIVSTYREQEDLNTFGGAGIPRRQTQLVLRQMLYDGFAVSSEINRLDHVQRLRYYELRSAMQNIALETVTAYIDIQRFRQLVSYAQDNYVTHKQLFDRIEERVSAGVGRRVDFEQASGRLALAEANLLTELTNLHDVTARYQRLVGQLPPDTLPEVDFYKSGVAPTATEALRVAYHQNPDLLAAIENIIAAQHEVSGQRAKNHPRLDLQARKTLDVSSGVGNSVAAADVLELTLNFNLFNGFADRAAINQTVERLNSTEDLRDKACVDTRQTVVIAYNDIKQLTDQLGYRDQHQLSIEKAREAYRRQFDIGQRTLLDLLDTENEYFQARRAYTNTASDLYTAYARTYAGQGELLSRLGVSRGDLPEMGRADYLDNQNVCQVAVPEMLKIDKAALIAQARPLNETLPSLSTGQMNGLPTSAGKATEKPAETPAQAAIKPEESIAKRVRDWASAWERKDFEAYQSFYSEGFVPVGHADKKGWLQHRKAKLVKAGIVSITLQNIKIGVEGDKASAEFTQLYSSPEYSDQVVKELRLEFEQDSGQWMIVREIVK
jgi:adhesin transport system outer membrane protein